MGKKSKILIIELWSEENEELDMYSIIDDIDNVLLNGDDTGLAEWRCTIKDEENTSDELTYEKKLEILNKLCNAKVNFSNYTNRFYVSIGAEIKREGFLSSATEHMPTKEEALNITFNRLKSAKVIVVDAYSPSRREVKYVDGEFVDI
jgi:hypothetical protein